MDLATSTVLITGGSNGIGLGLARKLISAGSQVIVTGRRQQALSEAKKQLPELHTLVSDAGKISDREALVQEVLETFPGLNVLVNNAGAQRFKTMKQELETDWADRHQEIAVNLEAPVHYANMLTPHFLKQKEAAIVNVTSGLAFIPCAFAPMYGATKAAMHSYTQAMRPNYRGTSIRIIELAPPPLKTDLPSSQQTGGDLGEFLEGIWPRLAAGEEEIGFGLSEEARKEGPDQIKVRFDRMTGMAFKGPTMAD
ncbi:hypothetical protein WJX73_003796 [Symbiochloris irregularis]|uniref:Uncharacterized protein n=1 Tax=Symbiochloris irregularis TaxID=706552 RepID=A0AAW1NK37_9CHLO